MKHPKFHSNHRFSQVPSLSEQLTDNHWPVRVCALVGDYISFSYRFPKIHGYPFEYPWFLDVSLQFSIEVWISTLISSRDIHARTSYKGSPWNMNIHEWISMFSGYQSSITRVFIDINLDIHWWIWTRSGFSIQGPLTDTHLIRDLAWATSFFEV